MKAPEPVRLSLLAICAEDFLVEEVIGTGVASVVALYFVSSASRPATHSLTLSPSCDRRTGYGLK